MAREELKTQSGLVISHKFNVLLDLTDKLLVIDRGLISQRGRHEELVIEEGLYKKLYHHYLSQRPL